MPPPYEDSELVRAQFNRLVQELLRGKLHRNTFQPWEIELLLDIEACALRPSARRDALKRYQKAVERQMERGDSTPMKLSEYLEQRRIRRENPAGEAPVTQ
ncbi:MAG TPA: hypothetical protein DEH78_14660 [Solibacterales bacterium]|nr:hypothetical protein [Bryobacterales bacterium]